MSPPDTLTSLAILSDWQDAGRPADAERTHAAIARWQLDGRPDGGEGLHRALVAQPNFAALGIDPYFERN